MEFISLDKKIEEAGKDKLRNVQLFGTDNFRSWMLYFEPGDATPMHYHQSAETFLVIDGKCSVQEMGERIFRLVLATASGERSKSEAHGYGQNEFVPWQVGAVM